MNAAIRARKAFQCAALSQNFGVLATKRLHNPKR
jgi:hypothetical protein